MTEAGGVTDWLLAGDPAITWQVRRDLLDDEKGARSDRARVATEGWGAAMLGFQDPEGTWANALYSPKWTSTTYSLLELFRYGLDPGSDAAKRGVQVLIDRSRYVGGGLTFFKTHRVPEQCITGMVITLASAFEVEDERIDAITAGLLDLQMADGGWNCELDRSGAVHGSFHTTITILEAMRERTRHHPDPRIDEAVQRAHTFFLEHRLYHSHRTGEIADPAFTRFSFPPRWHFDALRGLDYFQSVDAIRDPALGDSIALVQQRQADDGTWPLQNVHRNTTWFTMERGGRPSRWNTLRAQRVLRWWDGA